MENDVRARPPVGPALERRYEGESDDGVVDARIVGPIHETVAGLEDELSRLRLEVSNLCEELEPILKPRVEEKGDTIQAMPNEVSPHRERLLSAVAVVGELRNDVARVRGRLEI